MFKSFLRSILCHPQLVAWARARGNILAKKSFAASLPPATVTYIDALSFAKQEAQLNEVLSASNLDPTALTVVTRKLEVRFSDNEL